MPVFDDSIMIIGIIVITLLVLSIISYIYHHYFEDEHRIQNKQRKDYINNKISGVKTIENKENDSDDDSDFEHVHTPINHNRKLSEKKKT